MDSVDVGEQVANMFRKKLGSPNLLRLLGEKNLYFKILQLLCIQSIVQMFSVIIVFA